MAMITGEVVQRLSPTNGPRSRWERPCCFPTAVFPLDAGAGAGSGDLARESFSASFLAKVLSILKRREVFDCNSAVHRARSYRFLW